MSYLENKHKNIRESLSENIEAYLSASGYFSESGIVPGDVNPDGMANITIKPVNWNSKKCKIPRTRSIDILLEKPDKGIRRFSLIHPYIYKLIVKEVVDSIDTIRNRLLRDTAVEVYSIPRMFTYDDMGEDWKYFSQVDPAMHFSTHPFIVKIDINNFYESIYTHSISWALHTIDKAKNKSLDYSLVGNRLDKLFQNARDGQTNGIPTGNTASDIMAELVLKDIDESISEEIESLDIKAFRYRDDYIFMCKSKGDARKILDRLSLELNKSHGFAINRSKLKFYTADEYTRIFTESYEVTDLPPCIKQAITPLRGNEVLRYVQSLKDEAVSKNTSKRFDAGIKKLVDALKSMDEVLVDDDFSEWAMLIAHELIDSIEIGVSTSSVIYLLLDQVLAGSGNEESRIIIYLVSTVAASPNIMRKIWIYALLRKYDSKAADKLANEDTSPLLRMVLDDENQINYFSTRDKLQVEDLQALSALKIVHVNLFDEINEDAMIWDIIESDYYDSILRSHYDR